MKNCYRVSSAAAFVLMFTATILAQDCTVLQNAPPEKLVSYLDAGIAERVDKQCVATAIKSLGTIRYTPAVIALAKLLDFRSPHVIDDEMHTVYPAVTALEEIGQPSLPALLIVLKSPATSDKARDNALRVWMTIYRYRPSKGVAALRREMDAEKDAKARAELGWAISKAVTSCGPQDKTKCEAAATKRYSPR